MILKTPHGKVYRLFYLTSDMLDHLVEQSIPLNKVFDLASYHQKLTYSEIAYMLKFQYQVGMKMGVPLLDPKHLFGTGYNSGMIQEAFNAIGSEQLLAYYESCSHFNCIDAGGNVVLVLFNHNPDKYHVPGWDTLEAKTFSGALLETLFAKVGYMDCHFGKIPKPAVGEFSLAEVYKLLSIENP